MSLLGADEPLVYPALQERDGRRVSRSPWGPDDVIGRLNWMTPASQAAALAGADAARPFDLAVDHFPGMPSWLQAGDPKYDIWMTHTPSGEVADAPPGPQREQFERNAYAGSAITMYTHVGTHVCSLLHIGYDGLFWNGRRQADDLGSRAWREGGALPPIVARGVLLDVAGLHGAGSLPDSYDIGPADLRAAAARAGVEPQRGDVVFVRTGRMARWPDAEGFMRNPPGIGLEAGRYLAEEVGAMCVGVDCGGETMPPRTPGEFLPVHAYLLATAGVTVFENLWLEQLAAARVHRFALLAFPLKLRGSTGLPLRPVALPLT
ncbi:cyclase family protein [Conexibacter sp. CPCC 206217]|uniref:cyclase family protein n=1 Tax=Conexibacter sp. CPCC 206217 TaxID=3064574 RepID=UPI002716DF51|nr:cyclase family protein [Conexibacter sp. CPCC 206217]MDO8209555.1 cyclase family protein [Conexibacter sp. CPCC 206217]